MESRERRGRQEGEERRAVERRGGKGKKAG